MRNGDYKCANNYLIWCNNWIASEYGHQSTALLFLRKGVPLHMPNKVYYWDESSIVLI